MLSASLWQVSVERFRSTTPRPGPPSRRKLERRSSTADTPFHQSPTVPSSSPHTSGTLSGRGRCCLRPRTAPSTCGTGSTNRPAADQRSSLAERRKVTSGRHRYTNHWDNCSRHSASCNCSSSPHPHGDENKFLHLFQNPKIVTALPKVSTDVRRTCE